jgi:hypothetical protein
VRQSIIVKKIKWREMFTSCGQEAGAEGGIGGAGTRHMLRKHTPVMYFL